jgi:phosphatidylserine/phosphatidylglycerophosphate/cardiolipin synthase-like enzyme
MKESFENIDSPFASETIGIGRIDEPRPQLAALLNESPFVRLALRCPPPDDRDVSAHEREPVSFEVGNFDERRADEAEPMTGEAMGADVAEIEVMPAHADGADPSAAFEAAFLAASEPEADDRDSVNASHEQLIESEFRVDSLPVKTRAQFAKGRAAWRDAVTEAIRAGFRDAGSLADLIFFMQHPERLVAGVGKPMDKKEEDFFKLRSEWSLYRTIAAGMLKPSATKSGCPVFLPAIRSANYEDYRAAPTTGRITLMINGRNSGGGGPNVDATEAFDSMQKAVESLASGDAIFLSTWQVKPAIVPLTKPGPAGIKTWGDLFASKAKADVAIRMLITDFPKQADFFKSDLNALDALIDSLPGTARDRFKYVVSMHPARILGSDVGTHHQKFMVIRKGKTITAWCGGLDIAPPRTPAGWGGFVWHDVHAKLEGRIARDLEREFVLRWNREKDASTAAARPGWKAMEKLAQAPLDVSDATVDKNPHKLQMLRTVAVGINAADIRRDDIWQGYFSLIGCATRFLFMENQYFHEPKMADAIVRQTEAQPGLIVMIVVSAETDDPNNAFTEHSRALQHEFFTRLIAGIPSSRLRIYTMFRRLVHAKLILIDDRALSMGSANANPRGFFLDSELNVMLDDADAVRAFRHRLWAHDLNVAPATVATWKVADFMTQWDAVAGANDLLKASASNDVALKAAADEMAGEGVIPFDPRTVKGKRHGFIPDVLTEVAID